MVNLSMCVFVHSKQTLEPWCLTLYPPNYQDIHHIPRIDWFWKTFRKSHVWYKKNMIFKDQGGGESTCINMRPRAPIYYNCGEIYTLVTDKSVESVTEVSFTQYTLIQIMYPQVQSNMASRTIHQFRMIFPANKTSIVVMFNCYDWWHWSIHWIQHH